MGLLDGQTQQAYYSGSEFGNYQFTSLNDIINSFIVAYVGEDKIISKAKRIDVAFHAQRAMQELSFDTFKSCKAQEITVPATLQMPLPQDYVNYTKISWVDSSGIKHLMYPTSKTSNPTNPYQNDDGIFTQTMSATFSNGSTNIILDSVYHNIPIGTQVSGPSFGTQFVSQNLILPDGTQQLQFVDNLATPTYFVAASSFTETLTVLRSDILLDSTDVRAPIGWSGVIGTNIIIFDNATDTAGIKVGMVANAYPNIAAGTTVTGVNGKYVTLSANLSASTTSAGTSILFTGSINDSDTWNSYKSATPSENNNDDYEDDTYWPMQGNRYGLDPQHAQANGSYYIDCHSGKIHFSSNVSGKTVILDYISDSLGTDEEMQVHKFAEEALYKWIIYAMVSTRANIPEYVVQRYKKERFAETRKAKLRLSNIKLEEITQILRGKSKQIKH